MKGGLELYPLLIYANIAPAIKGAENPILIYGRNSERKLQIRLKIVILLEFSLTIRVLDSGELIKINTYSDS